MDKRYKVFHITYKVYPDLELMLKEKVFEYEREHNLVAVDFSVMYDKENDKHPQMRDSAAHLTAHGLPDIISTAHIV